MARAVTIYRFEYEKFDTRRGERVSWIANVAGFTQKEAERYLRLAVGDVSIRSIGTECRLDAISDEVRKVIVDAAQPKKRKPGRPPKKKKTTPNLNKKLMQNK